MRQANGLGRATIVETKEDVDEAQCERLGFDPQWCQSEKKTLTATGSGRKVDTGGAPVAGSFLTSLKNGAKTLLDWSDEGFKPVAMETAQGRGDVCTGRTSGNPCPHNQDRAIDFTSPLSAAIKGHIERKNGMKLQVDGEDNLKVCMLCKCWLPLKVWTPLPTLLGRMDEAMKEKFRTEYPTCWINTETTNQNPA